MGERAAPIVLFTGYPGQLGSELLPRVLRARDRDTQAICLVQQRFAARARARAEEIVAAYPALRGRIRLVRGDVTRPDLGLGATPELRARVVEVFHLAAVYDLGVGREPAMHVNVDGTRHLLDFARSCPALERFHYASTCFVSGRHPGEFTEDDLEVGQSFNNVYEETKFLAEVEVQTEMRRGLPASVYRPSIVVGDSATGATQKYDGLYFVVQWLLRQPAVALMPIIGDPARAELNLVPRDFVVDAIAYLSTRPDAAGRVFHLADPRPLTVAGTLDVLARALGKRILRIPFPAGLARAAIERVPGVYALTRIPSGVIDYFTHPARYGTARTQAALAGSDLRVPRFSAYADRLIAFMREHPEVGAAPMA